MLTCPRATRDQYKKRFRKWEINKNETAGRELRPRKPAASKLPGDAVIIPKDLFDKIRVICLESIQDKHWKLDDEFAVVDDDWEDAYGNAAELVWTLKKHPDSKTRVDTIRDDIAPMVQELNYFSLPTILIIAFKMCNELKDLPPVRNTAAEFLVGCLEMARTESVRSDRHKPLSDLFQHICSDLKSDMESLTDLLEIIIPCYIHLANDYANSESATALSLLTFYHIQVKRRDQSGLELTLEKILRILERAEKQKGKDDKATIEILGLALMVLQAIEGQNEKMNIYCETSMQFRSFHSLSGPCLENKDECLFQIDALPLSVLGKS